MKHLLKLFHITLLLTTPLISEARLLNIIHTNDLHSYFKGYRDGRGGYARLKTKIETLRSESTKNGIEVLQLDAGDFGEGTSFFLSDKGASSLKALDMLGTEVSVIGNHDHMMGGKVLGQQIRKAQSKTKFISANLVQTPEMDLGNLITPYVDINKAGISIRIIGLSTAEAHFQYPILPGFILPPVAKGVSLADQGRKAGKELIIALTHIGQSTDVQLAKKSSEIDLIVGGHSHDRLEEVLYVKNKKNKPVPIVQAGSHGLVVGSLLIDLKDDGSLEVVNYKLHEILDPLDEDTDMASLVAEAADNRNQYFGGRWDEVIGHTNISLSGYVDGKPMIGESCWGEHMAKMAQEATQSHMALHLAAFEGESLPPGPVKLGDIIDNFPHFRNYGDYGWEISTIEVSGKVLKTLLRAIVNLKNELGVNFYGLSYQSIKIPVKVPLVGGKHWTFKIRTNEEKINNHSRYTIAFPSEVGHALKSSLPPVAQKVFPSLKPTGKYYWSLMEDYIRSNSPIECLPR